MNFSKAFNPNDIRGIYGKEISDELVYKIGKAFITYFKLKKIVVGRDMRISSPTLFNSFVKGASEQGADVFDIGMISSDALYFATGYFNIPGAMITASHNPARYNGIKFSLEKAIPINGKEELKKIRNLAEKNNFQKLKMGRVIKKNIAPHYVKHVQSFIKKEKLRKMKVVVDAGNGMAGKMIPIVCKNLTIKIVPIEFFLDGNFPRH
ncbi:MAG: phosphomannomutase/phosphoglucomutase, partial [Candidatus Pacearchaeota archaeon]